MHECPDCGQACFCNGDIEDIDWGEDINCKHFLKPECDGNEDADDPE